MPAQKVNKSSGLADPLTLLGIGVLLISLTAGVKVVSDQGISFDIREMAMISTSGDRASDHSISDRTSSTSSRDDDDYFSDNWYERVDKETSSFTSSNETPEEKNEDTTVSLPHQTDFWERQMMETFEYIIDYDAPTTTSGEDEEREITTFEETTSQEPAIAQETTSDIGCGGFLSSSACFCTESTCYWNDKDGNPHQEVKEKVLEAVENLEEIESTNTSVYLESDNYGRVELIVDGKEILFNRSIVNNLTSSDIEEQINEREELTRITGDPYYWENLAYQSLRQDPYIIDSPIKEIEIEKEIDLQTTEDEVETKETTTQSNLGSYESFFGNLYDKTAYDRIIEKIQAEKANQLSQRDLAELQSPYLTSTSVQPISNQVAENLQISFVQSPLNKSSYYVPLPPGQSSSNFGFSSIIDTQEVGGEPSFIPYSVITATDYVTATNLATQIMTDCQTSKTGGCSGAVLEEYFCEQAGGCTPGSVAERMVSGVMGLASLTGSPSDPRNLQCVEFTNSILNAVGLGNPLVGANSAGEAVGDHHGSTKNGFTWLEADRIDTYKPGDVVIFEGDKGHVGICTSGGPTCTLSESNEAIVDGRCDRYDGCVDNRRVIDFQSVEGVWRLIES